VAVVETLDLTGPSPVNGDDIRVRLVRCAAEVFAERGYDRTGVAEIARRAGVTTGAIYNRFSGKAELLAAAIAEHTEDEFDALFADHRFQGRMEDIIRIAGSQLVERDESALPDLLLHAFVAARRDPEVAELLKANVAERQRRLTEIIDAAKADGGIDPSIDTHALVSFCHAVGFGFLVLDALEIPNPDHAPWEALITRLVSAVGATELTEPHPDNTNTNTNSENTSKES